MQIKQFSGATIDEVLIQVRAELGEDAVILQTKRVVKGGIGGFFGKEGVEVTAAEGLPAAERAANLEAAASVAVPARPPPARRPRRARSPPLPPAPRGPSRGRRGDRGLDVPPVRPRRPAAGDVARRPDRSAGRRPALRAR